MGVLAPARPVFFVGKVYLYHTLNGRILIMGAGGRYAFTPGHNIKYCVPPENIIAVYGAAQESGIYHLC